MWNNPSNNPGIEKLFFFLLLAVSLLPVVSVRFFPTTDGPAHLYNATLIKQLLFEPDNIASAFFYFHPQHQPNWIGHVLLALFQGIFPAWLSEKLLLMIYVTGMAFSFRVLVLQMNPNPGISTTLIFPFIYSFIFYLGFYNFLLSIPLIFFISWYWNRDPDQLTGTKFMMLSVLFLTVYFSHIVSFAIAVACVFTLITFYSERKLLIRKFSFIFCSLIPCLILSGFFIFNSRLEGFKGTVDYLSTTELFNFLTTARPLICYTHEEKDLSQIVFYVFVVLISVQLISRVIKYRKNKSWKNLIQPADSWLVMSIISGVLLFIIPDNIASGGFVSVRLSLFVFLFLALWLAIIDSALLIKGLGIVIVLFGGMKLSYERLNATSILSDEAEIVEQASGYIKENSLVLPLNYSTRWTTVNVLSYAGCSKEITLLDNYEANIKTFPLLWKPGADPSVYLGDQGKTNHPCIHILDYEKQVQHNIDYVITFQRDATMKDSCTLNTLNQLNTLYNKIFEDETQLVEVYKRK